MSRRPNGAARVVPETKRCAVYTRKSTDEGLDQEFNSLDAQRESGEAFIASQRHQGWECLPDRYDDGGFTGANIERPALRRLLADIEEGKVDAVVVYKVDRLSRSLLDFARLMEVFERRQVSFVSVTQQFNTATSMGRLVLNVLLSFAQFEREMIAERTRDKIAAARRKGKWTGGPVPIGYDVVDKKLVVNELEAVVVREVEVFSLYEQHRSALATARLLNEAGRTTKHHRANNGNVRAGKPWGKDAVLRVLKNPVYAGLMPGSGELHEAEHPPLIERARFLRVQAMLDARKGENRDHGRNPAYLLRGILRCARCGGAMTPASTRKARKEHRYYRCVTRDKQGRKACIARPLSADAFEAFVVTRIRDVAADGTLAADVERRLQARIESRRKELLTERRDLPPTIAKLSAEGRRLVEKIGEANGAAASLLDERIAEVADQLGRAEQRLAQVERAAAALDHAEIETRWIARALADFDAIWDVLTTDNRARLVRALVRSVTVDEPSGNVTALLTDLDLGDICPEGEAGDHADTHQAGGGRAAPSMEARA